ncbi:MAG: hypothetical protein LCH74_20275 [Proteobacteria bacterium]|nr:hypothetical protein [Pseudomonadota bacterium]
MLSLRARRGDRYDHVAAFRGARSAAVLAFSCSSADQVALYPARRPPAPSNAPSLLVERFFFDVRSMRKKRDPIADRASARLLEAWRKR